MPQTGSIAARAGAELASWAWWPPQQEDGSAGVVVASVRAVPQQLSAGLEVWLPVCSVLRIRVTFLLETYTV